jgi:hypothetical protein
MKSRHSSFCELLTEAAQPVPTRPAGASVRGGPQETDTPREANKLASEEREECASSLKQFFASTEMDVCARSTCVYSTVELKHIERALQATH